MALVTHTAATAHRAVGEWTLGVNLAARIIGFVCVILTVALWVITLTSNPTPASISAAIALTAIVAVVGTLNLSS